MSPSAADPGASARRPLGWVFLDRDGTLNVGAARGEYIERPEQLELLPGAAEAVLRFNEAQIWTGLVTNQRGIALGRMSIAELDAVHLRLGELLAVRGAHLDAIYYCPHASAQCDCRKPRPGMLLQARAEHPGLDFAAAAIIGDSLNDIQAGSSVGLRTMLIAPTAEQADRAAIELADEVVPDLLSAARLLCG